MVIGECEINLQAFAESEVMSQSRREEARALASTEGERNIACVEVGSSIFGSTLYRAGAARSLDADLLDATMHFLERYDGPAQMGGA